MWGAENAITINAQTYCPILIAWNSPVSVSRSDF